MAELSDRVARVAARCGQIVVGFGYNHGGALDEPNRPEGPQSSNLYVKDLPPGIKEDQLSSTFSQLGQVAECRML